MQRLEVSGAVRPLYGSLGVRGLICQMIYQHFREVSSSSWCYSLIPASSAPTTLSWGSLTRFCYRVRGSSLTPNHMLVDEASLFMFPGGTVAQLHPLALGIHFSRLLRQAWTTLRLFLLPVTTREFSGTYCLHFQATVFYIRSLETSRLCH